MITEKSSVSTPAREPPQKQVISLDRNLGFSTVHVYHEGDGTASDSDQTGTSNDPFLLVSNRKSSRKATKV